MRKKIIISIIILILGLILIFVSFTLNKNNSLKNKKQLTVSLINFKVKKEKNKLNLKFDLVNKDKETINNQIVYINFYNQTKKLYTFEFEINNLGVNDMQRIESFCEFEYQDITKYEFISGNKKIELNPIIDKEENITNNLVEEKNID